MNLSKIYLRYYPPGLALGYCSASGVETLQHIDLLELNINSNSDNIARSIILKQQQQNPKSHQFVDNDIIKCRSGNNNDGDVVLLTKDIRGKNTVTENSTHQQLMGNETAQTKSTVSVADTCITTNFTLAASSNCAPSNISAYAGILQQAILKLQRRLDEPTMKKFYQHRSIAQLLPLTNVCFDRDGARFLTGSYDRTCRIINTYTGREEHALRGHDNVVFAVAFNQPKCKKVVTGSFDGTAKIWNTSTGLYRATLYGHTAELVSVEFDPVQSATVATASMDCTARLFDVETALEVQTLGHHGAEVIASRFSRCGNLLLTGSFDATAAIWDIRSKRVIAQLSGHTAELSNCVWNFSCDLVATSSLDHTARVWDVRRLDQSLHHISDHSEEVLDVAFDAPGRLLATSSSDCTARVWNVRNALEMHSMMAGHSDEVSKVCFSPSGSLLLTASADHSARLWFTATGQCSQVLAGHESEVFSCAFSYTGDAIVTASKDNTCRLWR